MTLTDVRHIPFARPWITEEDRQAVWEVFDSPILTHGPQGEAFEEEFGALLGPGASSVAVSSCMAALHLSYIALGIGAGDEVIVPAQTHVAAAHAVEWVGAKPVFVDCDPTTGNLAAGDIAAAVGSRTKAISVVHYAGIPCDMPRIMAVAERHRLKVVEDCALALGSRLQGKHVGLFGDAGAFSFYPAKQITTGEGGMFVTRHPAVASLVAKLRAFGVDRAHSDRQIHGIYDVPTLGLNYRMSELQAALGRKQLSRLDENLRRRQQNFEMLKRQLGGTPGLRVIDALDPQARSSHYCLTVTLEGRLGGYRNDVAHRLRAAGIGTSVYYPHPVPRLSYYRNKYGYDAKRFPSATQISDCSLALPVGPHLGQEDVGHVSEQFMAAVEAIPS